MSRNDAPKDKEYSVAIPWHCSVLVKVEAKNKKEAIEKALADVYPSLCHQCSDGIELCSINDDIEPDVEEI